MDHRGQPTQQIKTKVHFRNRRSCLQEADPHDRPPCRSQIVNTIVKEKMPQRPGVSNESSDY